MQGARTSTYLASSPEVEGVTGKYFDSCRPIPSSPITYDLDVAVRLWQVSQELTGAPSSSSSSSSSSVKAGSAAGSSAAAAAAAPAAL
jgi:hypothetical protein